MSPMCRSSCGVPEPVADAPAPTVRAATRFRPRRTRTAVSPDQGGQIMSNSRSTGRARGRRKVVIGAAIGVLVAGALTAFIGQGVADAAKSTQASWLDSSQPVQARVNALLGAMTLPEKVG